MENRNLKFVQKFTVIVGSAVLNIIEVRVGRSRVTYASVNIKKVK